MNTRPLLRTLLLAVPFSLAAAACGDDPAGPGEDTLTDAEVAGLVEALMAAGSTGPDLPAPGLAATPSSASERITFPIDESFPCELGGTLSLEGSVTVVVDDAADTGSYEHEIEQVYAGCRVRSERLGRDFVLDGDPAVTSTMSAALEGGQVVDFQGSEVGAIRWSLGDRSGRCTVDLGYVVQALGTQSPTYQVDGTVCGRAVSEELDAEG